MISTHPLHDIIHKYVELAVSVELAVFVKFAEWLRLHHLNSMMRIVEERETTVELPEVDMGLETIKESQRRKYGNLIVLFSCGKSTVTIGPHYYFFIPTFLCILAGGLFLVSFVNSIFSNFFFQIFNACFSMLQSGAYLFVALSDPGVIVADDSSVGNSQNERQLIVCDKCGARHRYRRVRHCNYCNVCVRGYDHHCPWVSKCIGSANYSYFSFFVGITPLYIMYYVVVLLICLNVSLAAPASAPSVPASAPSVPAP